MHNQNKKIRTFIVKAFLRIDQNDPDILASFQDQLYALGNLIKQRDEELYNEIIRTWTSEWTSQKIKIEMNRTRRQ